MKTARGSRGFTLLETIVVLGLLTVFCLSLTQILRLGVTLFDEGESGQDLADRAQAAGSAVGDSVLAIIGPVRDLDPGQGPEARLLVERIPFGLDPGAAKAGARAPSGQRIQLLRSTVRLDPEQEDELLALRLREDATARRLDEAAVELRVREGLATAPRSGRGTMWLAAWPSADKAADPDGAYLQIRRGLFLPSHRIRLGEGKELDPAEFDDLMTAGITRAVFERETKPIASAVLYFEVSLWSQLTRDWEAKQEYGPERVWDSARAGLLSGAKDPRENFTFDLAPASLSVTSDDIWPHYVRVTLVVDRGGAERAAGVLARDLGPAESEISLYSTEHLPPVEDAPFLKVGTEWIEYRKQGSSSLGGVLRGRRGTAAVDHPAGTRVRAGKTIVMTLKTVCGRDCWNG
jgi:hypothetical protein